MRTDLSQELHVERRSEGISTLKVEAAYSSELLILEELRLLGCGAVWVCYEPMFRRNISPPSSEQKKLRERRNGN
jgi:hypothetical protein